jgi:hypothetical protein
LDGVVDGQDFNIWNQNRFTSYATWLVGDFDGDRTVDGRDFNIWNENRFSAAVGADDHVGAGRVPRAPLAAHVARVAITDLAFTDHDQRVRATLRPNRETATSALTMTDAAATYREVNKVSRLRRQIQHPFAEPWPIHSVVHQQVDGAADERTDRVLRGQVVDRVLSDW